MRASMTKGERAAAVELSAAVGLRQIGDDTLWRLRAGRNFHELCRERGLKAGDMRDALFDAERRERDNGQDDKGREGGALRADSCGW